MCVCLLTRVAQIVTAGSRDLYSYVAIRIGYLPGQFKGHTIPPPGCQLSVMVHGLLVDVTRQK